MTRFTNVAKKRRLLPDDAAPGEEAALVYFLHDDRKIAFAWWFFCLWCADHKPAFSRQLEQLAVRAGRPVTHVDGIRVALRFWELSMSADASFADKWRADRESEGVPEQEEWGGLKPLMYQLAAEEWFRLLDRQLTDEEKRRADLWEKTVFKRQSGGQTAMEFMSKHGFGEHEGGIALVHFRIRSDAADTARAFAMWAVADHNNKLTALADRALLRGPSS